MEFFKAIRPTLFPIARQLHALSVLIMERLFQKETTISVELVERKRDLRDRSFRCVSVGMKMALPLWMRSMKMGLSSRAGTILQPMKSTLKLLTARALDSYEEPMASLFIKIRLRGGK